MGNQEVIMFNRIFFSKRIKQLRKSYKFTIIEFSTYFQLVSKTSVGAWEKATAIPSADVLADLSTFFGISMDWFAGFSSIPYTKESIENAERNVLNKVEEADKDKIFLHIFPKEYISCEQREKLYSLPVRANIIVLLHCVYIPMIGAIIKANENLKTMKQSLTNKPDGFALPIYQFDDGLTPKEQAYSDNLLALLNRKITTPIYDIESGEIK